MECAKNSLAAVFTNVHALSHRVRHNFTVYRAMCHFKRCEEILSICRRLVIASKNYPNSNLNRQKTLRLQVIHTPPRNTLPPNFINRSNNNRSRRYLSPLNLIHGRIPRLRRKLGLPFWDQASEARKEGTAPACSPTESQAPSWRFYGEVGAKGWERSKETPKRNWRKFEVPTFYLHTL